MRINVSLYFFISFADLLLSTGANDGNRTTCTFPPAVVGEEARLTCHFPIDVTSTSPRPSIKIRRHVHGGALETVLDCDWEGSDLNCFTLKDGFHFDQNVSSKLILVVPNATFDYSGSYDCQLFPAHSDSQEPCVFTVENSTALPDVGIGSSCAIRPVLKGENATLQCQFTRDLNTTQTGFRVYKASPDESQKAVLACNWKYKGTLKCDRLASGYEFSYISGSHFNISIPEATDQFVGTYTCKVDEEKSEDTKNCSFTLESSSEPETEDGDIVTIVVPTVVAIIAVIVVVVIVIVIVLRCKRPKRAVPQRDQPLAVPQHGQSVPNRGPPPPVPPKPTVPEAVAMLIRQERTTEGKTEEWRSNDDSSSQDEEQILLQAETKREKNNDNESIT